MKTMFEEYGIAIVVSVILLSLIGVGLFFRSSASEGIRDSLTGYFANSTDTKEKKDDNGPHSDGSDHDYIIIQMPTCTKTGIQTCKICAQQMVLSEEGHVWREKNASEHICKRCEVTENHNFIIKKKATCVDSGLRLCTDCNYKERIPMTKHVYVTERKATCTDDGVRKCSTCQDEQSIPATGHDYKVTSQATCTVPIIEKCNNCGDRKEVGLALGHNYRIVKEATCTEAGYKKCGRCEDTITLPALGHDFEPNTAATCEKAATEKCSECGVIRNVGEPKGHHYSVSTPATCTTASIETCDSCKKTRMAGSALGHTYKTTPASCEKNGVKKCVRCGSQISIPKLGHVWVANGSGEKCSRKGCTVTRNYHNYVVTTSATCTSTGMQYCSSCGRKEVINSLGHNFVITKEKGCVENGLKTCTRCSETEEIESYGGHNMTGYSADCTSYGYYWCTRPNCNYSYSTSPWGHNGDPCTRCGYTSKQNK